MELKVLVSIHFMAPRHRIDIYRTSFSKKTHTFQRQKVKGVRREGVEVLLLLLSFPILFFDVAR